MDGAIIPISYLNNRSEKRKFTKDALKVVGKLEEVNTSFLWHLFNMEDSKTYKEIYLHFLSEWNRVIDQIIKSKKITQIGIDRLFFEREYKPQLYIK